eukprot:3886195-Pyramimonas_sp.AAC.1
MLPLLPACSVAKAPLGAALRPSTARVGPGARGEASTTRASAARLARPLPRPSAARPPAPWLGPS